MRTVLSLVKEAVDREDLSQIVEANGLSRPGILLRDAGQRANKVIYQTAKTQAKCEGMGTTVVAGLFFDDKLTMAERIEIGARVTADVDEAVAAKVGAANGGEVGVIVGAVVVPRVCAIVGTEVSATPGIAAWGVVASVTGETSVGTGDSCGGTEQAVNINSKHR